MADFKWEDLTPEERDYVTVEWDGMEVPYERFLQVAERRGYTPEALAKLGTPQGKLLARTADTIGGRALLQVSGAMQDVGDLVVDTASKAGLAPFVDRTKLQENRERRQQFDKILMEGGQVPELLGPVGAKVFDGAINSFTKAGVAGMGGAAAVYGLFGAEAANDAHNQALASGMDGVSALSYGLERGVVETGISFLMGRFLTSKGLTSLEEAMTPGLRHAAKRVLEKNGLQDDLATLAKRAAGGSLGETTEEIVQDFFGQTHEMAEGYRDGFDWEQMFVSGLTGAVAAGGANAVSAVAEKYKPVIEKLNALQPELENAAMGAAAAEAFVPQATSEQIETFAAATPEEIENIIAPPPPPTQKDKWVRTVLGTSDTANQLTKEQSDALFGYTENTFSFINKHLRGFKIPDKERAQKLAGRISTAIKKLPPMPATTYRGVGFEMKSKRQQAAFKSLKPGAVFTDAGFFSTTLDRKVAETFVSNAKHAGGLIAFLKSLKPEESPSVDKADSFKTTTKTVLFEVEGKSGRDISGFVADQATQEGDLNSNEYEKEIIYDRGTSFEVLSVEKNASGTYVVKMKEVESGKGVPFPDSQTWLADGPEPVKLSRRRVEYFKEEVERQAAELKQDAEVATELAAKPGQDVTLRGVPEPTNAKEAVAAASGVMTARTYQELQDIATRYGQDGVYSPGRLSQAVVDAEVRRMELHTKDSVAKLVDEVNANPNSLTVHKQEAMKIRGADIEGALLNLQQQLNQAESPGQIANIEADMHNLGVELARIGDAMQRGGTPHAQLMAFRRLGQTSWGPIGIVASATTAKKAPLTDTERRELLKDATAIQAKSAEVETAEAAAMEQRAMQGLQDANKSQGNEDLMALYAKLNNLLTAGCDL